LAVISPGMNQKYGEHHFYRLPKFSGLANYSSIRWKAFNLMIRECNYSEAKIPQLEEVSSFLKSMESNQFRHSTEEFKCQ